MSSAALTQENRMLQVHTPLGRDVLLLKSFSGSETMSQLFSYRLEMESPRDSIQPNQLVGRQISFCVRLDDKKMRWFNGHVIRLAAGHRASGLRRYTAEVVPWLWFLTRMSDCRAFQEMTVPDILKKIFEKHGSPPCEFGDLKGNYTPWEYCVQYNETDFNFVSRLMEQEGIFYYFKHSEQKHTLVLADQKGTYKNCPENQVEQEYSFSTRMRVDRITDWDHRFEYTSGKWSQTDYNFEDPAKENATPAKILHAEEPSTIQLDGNGKLEMFYYPGEYENQPLAKSDTKLRIEAEETRHDVVQASSTCRTFTLGGKFTLTRHEIPSEVGKEYVITAISHLANEPSGYASGGRVDNDYNNTFTCIPSGVTYRPPRMTSKPLIYGCQTAVVTGPPGEEIWPDKYGRVKVQFFWDRYGERNEKSSCWVRCAQPSAGKGWGMMSIPRVGQEVVVTFVDGDPDRPLITGVVYNADQMPPYELPGSKTTTALKSNSSPGGNGFNELRLDDTAGEEQIFLHAQKNWETRVLNDSLRIIGRDEHAMIGRDSISMIGRHEHELVGENSLKQVGKNLHEAIGEDHIVEVAGDSTLTVAGDLNETAGGARVMTAGGDVHVMGGGKIVIQGGSRISLVGPGGFVDIGPAGVTIQGVMVKINSGGAAATCKQAKQKKPDKPKDPTEAANSSTGKKSAPDALR